MRGLSHLFGNGSTREYPIRADRSRWISDFDGFPNRFVERSSVEKCSLLVYCLHVTAIKLIYWDSVQPDDEYVAPGPSRFLVVGSTLSFVRDPFSTYERWAEEYGDIVATDIAGRTFVMVAHPDHIERILAHSPSISSNSAFTRRSISSRISRTRSGSFPSGSVSTQSRMSTLADVSSSSVEHPIVAT